MDRDVDLIEATLSGDKSAFGTLVSLYQKKVYRFVYRIIYNSSDASDIVQETFVNAYQNLEHLKDRDKFSLWLYQIAKNRCVDWIRKRQSNLLAIEDELSQERLYLPPAPDEILIEQETYQHIIRIIAKLPERRRRAVEMFYLEGRSYSEIQDELGITKGTLGRWLYKARLELRRNSKQFISAVTFWLNDGMYSLSKLVSKGIVTNVSTVSVAKCLVISMMIHLMIFAQLSGNGISNNKNGISYPNPAIQAYLLDQAKLDHILPDSQISKGSRSKISGMNDPAKRSQISKVLDKRVISPYIPYYSGKLKKSLNSISNTKSIISDYQPKYTLNAQYSTPLIRTNNDSLNYRIYSPNSIHSTKATKLIHIGYDQNHPISSGLSGTTSDNTQKSSNVVSFGADDYVLVRTLPEKPEKDKNIWFNKMALDSSGNIYVSNLPENCIMKFSSEWELLARWGEKGSNNGKFKGPCGIAIDNQGYVYVADQGNYRIQKFDPNGKFIKKMGKYGYFGKVHYDLDYDRDAFKSPVDVAIDNSGNVLTVDSGANCIVTFDSNGVWRNKWGEKGSRDSYFKTPISIAIDKSGNIYIADQGNHRIQKFNTNGGFIGKWGVSGSDAGEIKYFSGIAVDKSGNVFVSDSQNFCVQKFDTNGVLLAKWGKRVPSYDPWWIGPRKPEPDDGFICPSDIAVDDQGNVYVLDSYRIKIFRLVGDK